MTMYADDWDSDNASIYAAIEAGSLKDVLAFVQARDSVRRIPACGTCAEQYVDPTSETLLAAASSGLQCKPETLPCAGVNAVDDVRDTIPCGFSCAETAA